MIDLADLEGVREGLSAVALRGLTCGSHRKVKVVSFPPEDEAEEALEPRFSKLHRELTLHEESRGTHDLCIGFPFISGVLGRGLTIQAPLFFFPVTLEPDLDQGRFSGWQIQGRPNGDACEVNRFLLLALRRFARKNLSADELVELVWTAFYEGGLPGTPDDPRGYLSRIIPHLTELGLPVAPTRSPKRSGDPATDPLPVSPPLPADGAGGRFLVGASAVLGRFRQQGARLAEDYLDLLRSIKRDDDIDRNTFWARVAMGEDDGGLGATKQTPAITKSIAGPPGDHLWPVVEWDGDQEAILGRAGWGKDSVVEAPSGTGKTQTLVNLAAATQARGATMLVVSDRREGLEELQRRLDAVGLGDGAAIVLDPAIDRENVYRAVRKRLRKLPPASTGTALAAREKAIETMAIDVEWFDSLHTQLVGRGGPRSPFTCYVRRLGRPLEYDEELVDDLIDSLPVIEPPDLDALLVPLQAYCKAKLKTLVPTESVPKRPSYAGRTRDDLRDALDRVIPAASAAIRAAREWADSPNAPGITAEVATEAEAGIRKLKETMEDAPPLGHPAWGSMATACEWLGSSEASSPSADPVAGDARRIERYIERRAKGGGKFLRLPEADWGDLKEDLDAWDEFEEQLIRVINPNFYALKKRLQEILRKEKLGADDVARGVKRLKRRLALGRLVATTAATLSVTRLDRHALRKAPDAALRAAPNDAKMALEFVRRWKDLPDEYAETVFIALPKTRKEHDSQLDRIRHALAAPPVHRAIEATKKDLLGWIGPSAEGWVDYAFQQNRPELLEGWFEAEVSTRFDELAAADQLVADVEAAHAVLAEQAVGLARAGDKTPDVTLAGAFAERWIRDAEADAPVLAEFNEGADRRRRKRLNETTTALLEGGLDAVKERISERLNALPEGVSDLEEILGETGRSPVLKKIVERFWDQGLRTLVPIWLCTPEAVSAGLPLTPGRFDIVVFDEAEALSVERAVPAARRARTALVFGDSRRPGLDPDVSLFHRARACFGATRYTFAHGAGFPHLTDARRSLDPRTLLRSAPLFHPRPKPPAIELIRIAGSWRRRGNDIEADAAAELLGQLMEADPHRSVAIVTASTTQRDCILARIRRRGLRSRGYRAIVGAATGKAPGLQAIVRSVDDLRGEARDIVLFAPGVAKDGPGSITASLGALGEPGAAILLDGMMAAARTKAIVLSSIDPEADLPDDGPVGALRRFLLEATSWTHGGRRSFTPRTGLPDSVDDLAKSVVDAIEKMGYGCERDVGATDCRVDIAVRDKVRPRPFVLAVLLDGPTSSWATGTRLREHSRWDLLRAAGWPVTSVSAWSWLRHREEVKERLKTSLEKAATGRRPRPTRPPPIGPMPSGTIE
jgi:hypothetical protein